jgi:hypothetical protein
MNKFKDDVNDGSSPFGSRGNCGAYTRERTKPKYTNNRSIARVRKVKWISKKVGTIAKQAKRKLGVYPFIVYGDGTFGPTSRGLHGGGVPTKFMRWIFILNFDCVIGDEWNTSRICSECFHVSKKYVALKAREGETWRREIRGVRYCDCCKRFVSHDGNAARAIIVKWRHKQEHGRTHPAYASHTGTLQSCRLKFYKTDNPKRREG